MLGLSLRGRQSPGGKQHLRRAGRDRCDQHGQPRHLRPDIFKGIHLSMAGRYLKLLRAIDAHGHVAITGGLSADTGLVRALQEKAREDGLDVEIAPIRRRVTPARWAQRCGERIVSACWPVRRRYRHERRQRSSRQDRDCHRRLGRHRQRHRSACSRRGRQQPRWMSQHHRARTFPGCNVTCAATTRSRRPCSSSSSSTDGSTW